MNIAIIGGGRVGLPVATVFAQNNNSVVCCEKNPDNLSRAQDGIAPFHEPNLEPMMRKNIHSGALTFVADISNAVKEADVCFITLATCCDNHEALRDVTKEIAASIPKNGIVVIKSTVLPTTCDSLAAEIGNHAHIAMNPEFLREGSAIEDFSNPDRIVIGADEESVFQKLRELYSPWINRGVKLMETTLTEAEIIKVAANSFLAARIAMINEISDLCASINNANIDIVCAGIAADNRIGNTYISPSIGIGGSCLPKDCQLLKTIGQTRGLPMDMVKTVLSSNDKRCQRLIQEIKERFSHLDSPTVAVWGLTFKPDSDDARESIPLKILKQLQDMADTWDFLLYDPNFQGKSIGKHQVFGNWKSSLTQADGLITLSAHSAFKGIDYENVRSKINGGLILDLAHVWQSR